MNENVCRRNRFGLFYWIDCEFGDRSLQCDPNKCNTYDSNTRDKICCYTCSSLYIVENQQLMSSHTSHTIDPSMTSETGLSVQSYITPEVKPIPQQSTTSEKAHTAQTKQTMIEHTPRHTGTCYNSILTNSTVCLYCLLKQYNELMFIMFNYVILYCI